MSRAEEFPYTDRQRRWWFATQAVEDQKVAENEAQRKAYTKARQKTEDAAASSVRRLYPNVAVQSPSGEAAMRWDGYSRKPWRVEDATGWVIKQFDTAEEAKAFLEDPKKIAAAVKKRAALFASGKWHGSV